MELNEEHLKEKALLLVRRERELFELRMKHERVTVWLQLAQTLPRFFEDPQTAVNDAYAHVRKALITALRWQRVSFFELGEQTLTPIVPVGLPRPLAPAALELLQHDAAGFHNDPSHNPPSDNDPSHGAGAALAEVLGLARFVWSRIDVAGRAPVVLAAGFDRAKAKFQLDFDAGDAAHLRNATQHLQGLIGNLLLVHELQLERDRLQHTNHSLEQRDRELHALTEDLRAANDTLEQRVRDRTEELGRRNRDMRLVLDHVVQGLVTLDAAGRLARERSARVDEWFGSYEDNPSFVEYIGKVDPGFAERFALLHEALQEGIMPADICIDQLPTQLRAGARSFACSYRPLAENAGGTGLLIMIDDVTEAIRLRQEDAEQSELLAVFQRVTRDRDGFLAFFSEANFLVGELLGGALNEVTLRRHLHTLKGSAAIQGAKVIAELCHRAEDQLSMVGSADAKATIHRLGERWAAIQQVLAMKVGERAERVVEIPSSALDRLCDEIDGGMPVDEIAQQLTFFRFEPVARPLERLAEHARVLAQRIGRAEPSIRVEASDTRVDPRRFGPLWAALVHVLGNALDHGIEPPVERLSRGKSAQGRLSIRSSHTTDELTLEIEDDGRGIDWDHVREIAQARGLPHRSQGDLVSALLTDGFSTKSSVTEISGRGVGMSAVYAQVTELGGTLSLTSDAGVGSCWTMVLPVAASNSRRQVVSGQNGCEREPKLRQAR